MESATVPETFSDGSTRMFVRGLAISEKGYVRNRAVTVEANRYQISSHLEVFASSHPNSRDAQTRATVERVSNSTFIFTCAPLESLNGQKRFQVTLY